MNEHLSLSSVTLLTPGRPGLCEGRENVVDVLVRIQAPDAPAEAVTARPPQALALVVDRSGSMAGKPLAEAQRCADFVVSRLRAGDAAAVVQFDNRVERLWPAVPVADGAAVRGAIRRIHAGGNTNLHGGWLEGATALADMPGSGLKRVILLSDGCANEGVVDAGEIAAQCAAWAAWGITTSTYGLGDNFNEELMVAMARAGGGSHYYGDTANDLMEPFQQELDLLANLAMRNVEMWVWAPDGIAVEMLNDMRAAGNGWRLPDLAWGSEAWAVLRLRVPAGALPSLGNRMALLRVSVTGQTLQGEPVVLERVGLALPVLTQAAFDALMDDELVRRRLAEVEAGHELERMRAAAQAGDWQSVDALLNDAQARFARSEWLSSILAAMAGVAQGRSRERMMKETRYSSAKLSARLAAKDEHDTISFCESASSYLRRKPLQGKGDL